MRTKFTLLGFVLLLLFSTTGYAQIQFWADGFESTGPSMGGGTRSTDVGGTAYPASPPYSRYFKQTTLADINDITPFFQGVVESQVWAAEDIDGALDGVANGQSSEQWVRWSGINITGKTGLSFTGKFATTLTTVWDHQTSSGITSTNLADYVIMQYELNGSGTWITFLAFHPNVAGSNSCALSVDSNFDGTGDGTALNNTLTDFTASIPVTGTSLAIRCKVSTNAQNEEIAFDDFRMFETPACTAPSITAQPPTNSDVCTGGTKTIAITATGATTYQWQVDASGTGSGPWTDLTNTGFYTGVTTNTLTITGANATINGYDYRCNAINGVASCFTTSGSSNLRVSTINLNSNAQSNVSCFNGSNGSAVVIPSGGINGTAPGAYTYSWSPSGGTGQVASGLAANTYTVTVTDAALPGCTAQRSFTITQPPTAVSATSVVTNVACNSGNTGAINLTPTGGTPGYFVNWGGGVFTEDRTNLTAGTYSVTVEDANGCQAFYSITVTQPPALNGTTVVTNVACNGGTTGAINLTPSGGAGPYTFNWGGGITTEDRTNLTAGTYSVTITDANGCTGTVSATLTQPTAVSGTTVVTNVACFGGNTGAINLTPTGGTGPYTFNWGSGITTEDRTSLTAGTYSVTITDANACTGTVSVTVTQPTAPVSGTTVVTNVACFGGNTGAINLTPTGGTGPYTFNWIAGPTTEDRTSLTAGTYSVTITDANGCTGTVSGISVTQPTAPVSGTTVVTNVACFGGNTGAINLTPNGGTGPYTFNWIAGPTTEDRTSLTAGTYSVTITDANGCTGTVSGISVTQPPTAVSGTTVVTNVACFGGNTGAINLTPTGGTGPYTFNWVGGITTEDRTSLTAGTYSVTITDANACTGTVSVTVTQPTAPVSGTTVVTNVACFGGNTGAINLTPTGGTGPYTFNWTAGPTTEDRTSLTAGTYSVTITDANACTGTVSVTVTEPPAAVSGTTVVTNVACFGGNTGAINLTPTGGTMPYTFNWGSGITTEDRTSLTAGTYSVTITDANACTGTVSVTVTEPPAAVSGTTVVTNVACFGGNTGAINLTPTGGTGPYTFDWGSGITTEDRTSLTAGTYSVTITDANACTGTVSVTVTQSTAPVSGTTVVTNVACFGGNTGAINLTPTGGTGPYTFNWGGGITTEDRTSLTAGTYSVTITDANACTGTVSVTVTQPTAPVSGTTVVTNVACFGGNTGAINLTPTGGTGPYTFDWGSGITTEDRTSLTAGTYSVTITDANSCTGTVSVTVTEPTAPVSGTTVATNVSCFGGANGAINLTPTGGTGPYTFNWGGGITTEDRTGLAAGTYSVTITDVNGCTGTASATLTEPTAIVASAGVQTSVSCNGGSNGSATVDVTGGTPGYTYSWSPSGGTGATATGLAAGTYTATVTDANSCQATQSFTITEPAAIGFTAAAQTNVACNGGSNGALSVNAATGGTGAFTYDWTPGTPTGDGTTSVSDLAAGTYTVTATDDNSCTATLTFTITEPAALVATAGAQTDVSCNGGSNGTATLALTGGTPGYTYSWSPSGGTGATATGLAAGTYTATGTDANGCTATATFTITEPTALVATAGTQTDVSCNGGSNGTATVNVTGGTPGYTYSWSPSGGTGATATGLAAGTYTATVTDANLCQTTQSFTITEPTALVATAGAQTDVSCNSGSNGTATVNVTGGTPGYFYSWSPSGGTGATATGLAAGTYTVTVTDANSCQTTQSFTITEPAAIVFTTASQTDLECNGEATGAASVNAATGGTGTFTYDWAPGTPTGDGTTSVTDLAAGTYTVTATDQNGCTATQSFTITEPAAITGTMSATECDSFTHNGETYTTSGVYTQVLTAANGCDSTLTLNITILNSTTSTMNITSCEDYTLNGQTYTTSGVYTQNLANAAGCDSTITLNLTINVPTTSTLTVSSCVEYTLNGETYNASGVYTQNLTNAAGCDSTLTLNLTILEPTTSSLTETACDTYTLNSETYTTSGVYTQVIANAAGCDSTITLNLTILESTSSTLTETACDTYTLNGETYTVSGIYTQSTQNAAGCDSTITLNLTILNSTASTMNITACDSYMLNGETYTASGVYTQELTNAAGCDSTITLNLTILTTPVAGVTQIDAVTLQATGTGTTYQWIDCDTGLPIAGANGSTYTFTSNGSYAVTISNGNCSSTSACIVVDEVALEEAAPVAFVIAPNPTNDLFTVTMTDVNAADVVIYDAQGKVIMTVPNAASGDVISLGDAQRGMYLVHVVTSNGTHVERLMKQ